MTTTGRPAGGAPWDLRDRNQPQMLAASEDGSFVGRSGELGLIAGLLQEATRGGGRVALVEGEAGVGKTRLLAEALAQAAASDVQLFCSAAHELERRRPFGVLADSLGIRRSSLEDRRREIADLLEHFSPAVDPLVPAAQVEFRVAEAIVALIEDLCARNPVALWVDDLQWADPSSLLALHRLERRLSGLPALLLCSLRPTPRSHKLRSLVDNLVARGALHLALEPLDAAAAEALTATLVRARPGPRLLAKVAGSGGNPLFLIELVSALSRGGMLRTDDEGTVDVEPEAEMPSSSLRSTLLHRLSFLPPQAAELLRAASVLGTRFSVEDLSLLLERSPASLAPTLRCCLRAGLLETEEERLAFRHDLIREALYRELPLAVRTALHRQVAYALGSAGAAPERVAEHLMRGATSGDPRAVGWLHRAAREVAPRSPSAAAELLQRALELVPASAGGRDLLLAELAVSLMWAGRLPEAEGICREALARPHEPGAEALLRLCLTETLLIGEARMDEARREAEAAIASPSLAAQDRPRFQALLSHAQLVLGELDRAVETAGLAGSAGGATGDHLASCFALETQALVAYLRGHFGPALALIDQAVELADRSPAHEGHRHPLNLVRALCLMDLDRAAEARDAIRFGRRLAEELGTVWDLPVYHFGEAVRLFRFGGWDDALAEIRAGLTLAEEVGVHWEVAARAHQALIALHRNALGAAQEAIAAGERRLADSGPQWGVTWLMWARGLLLEASGNPPGAVAVMTRAWQLCTAVGLAADYPFLGPDLVRLTVAGGDRDRAEEVAAQVAAVAAGNAGTATLQGAALRCRGLADDDPDALLEAVACYRAGPRPFELGIACEEAGAALAGRGLTDDARCLLDEALEVYHGLQADRDIARTEARMRRLGLRRGRYGRRAGAKSGWAALTPSERRVVEFVAGGLSNSEVAERLFLSRHTVHTHLGNALAKLGFHSRVELAAAVAGGRLVPPDLETA